MWSAEGYKELSAMGSELEIGLYSGDGTEVKK